MNTAYGIANRESGGRAAIGRRALLRIGAAGLLVTVAGVALARRACATAVAYGEDFAWNAQGVTYEVLAPVYDPNGGPNPGDNGGVVGRGRVLGFEHGPPAGYRYYMDVAVGIKRPGEAWTRNGVSASSLTSTTVPDLNYSLQRNYNGSNLYRSECRIYLVDIATGAEGGSSNWIEGPGIDPA